MRLLGSDQYCLEVVIFVYHQGRCDSGGMHSGLSPYCAQKIISPYDKVYTNIKNTIESSLSIARALQEKKQNKTTLLLTLLLHNNYDTHCTNTKQGPRLLDVVYHSDHNNN